MHLQHNMDSLSHIYNFKIVTCINKPKMQMLYRIVGWKPCGSEPQMVTKILKFPLDGDPEIRLPTGRTHWIFNKRK